MHKSNKTKRCQIDGFDRVSVASKEKDIRLKKIVMYYVGAFG